MPETVCRLDRNLSRALDVELLLYGSMGPQQGKSPTSAADKSYIRFYIRPMKACYGSDCPS